MVMEGQGGRGLLLTKSRLPLANISVACPKLYPRPHNPPSAVTLSLLIFWWTLFLVGPPVGVAYGMV